MEAHRHQDQFPGFTRLADPEPVLERYRSRFLPGTVVPPRAGHVVPVGLASYLRVLPPLQVWFTDSDRPAEHWRWSTTLAAYGASSRPGQLVSAYRRILPALTEAGIVTEPLIGALGWATLRTLARILARAETPELAGNCYLAFPPDRYTEPVIYTGRLRTRTFDDQPADPAADMPSSIWPPDLTWALAIDTDSPAGYVAGSSVLIQQVAASQSLETASVDAMTLADDWPGGWLTPP